MKRVFSRQLNLPPGAPWDQSAAAHMDAMNGAPAPVEDLLVIVRRLDLWVPGRPSNFVIAYARRSDVDGVLKSKVEVGGRTLTLRFAETEIRRRIATFQLAALGAGVIGVSLGCSGVITAIDLRSGRETTLELLETKLVAQSQAAARRRSALVEAQAVQAIGGRATTADVAKALDLLSRQRSEAAGVVRVRWTPHETLIESLGPLAPASDAVQMRMLDPTGAGLHFWLVRHPAK